MRGDTPHRAGVAGLRLDRYGYVIPGQYRVVLSYLKKLAKKKGMAVHVPKYDDRIEIHARKYEDDHGTWMTFDYEQIQLSERFPHQHAPTEDEIFVCAIAALSSLPDDPKGKRLARDSRGRFPR